MEERKVIVCAREREKEREREREKKEEEAVDMVLGWTNSIGSHRF